MKLAAFLRQQLDRPPLEHGRLIAAALSGWALGPVSIVLVPVFALALAASSWLVFPARALA